MRTDFAVLATLGLIAGLQGCVRHVAPPVPADQVGPEPPPGMVEVDFVSNERGRIWDVYVGDNLVCRTPCLRAFPARESFFLESQRGEAIFIPEVGPEAAKARRALVVAESTHSGKRVNGIVFTTLGGMGLITGITLTAAGCSNLSERAAMCNAGLITGGISLPLTAAAIWMIVDARPRAHVLPILPDRPSGKDAGVKVTVTPTGLAGTF